MDNPLHAVPPKEMLNHLNERLNAKVLGEKHKEERKECRDVSFLGRFDNINNFNNCKNNNNDDDDDDDDNDEDDNNNDNDDDDNDDDDDDDYYNDDDVVPQRFCACCCFSRRTAEARIRMSTWNKGQ